MLALYAVERFSLLMGRSWLGATLTVRSQSLRLAPICERSSGRTTPWPGVRGDGPDSAELIQRFVADARRHRDLTAVRWLGRPRSLPSRRGTGSLSCRLAQGFSGRQTTG